MKYLCRYNFKEDFRKDAIRDIEKAMVYLELMKGIE
jgi:hypothetical protein